MYTNIVLDAFPPFNTLVIPLPSHTPIHALPAHIAHRLPPADYCLSTAAGTALALSARPLASLAPPDASYVRLRATPRLLGGKGGFGSQLRAAGGRMSSQKTSNNDSCRDLSGRRLSTIKEAKKMAEYLEAEPLRKKAAAEAQKAKLEALERQLGLAGKGSTSTPLDDPTVLAGKKRRFDDTEYLEQSKEIVDSVKNAVVAGLLKKRKKAKLASSSIEETCVDTAKTAQVDTPSAGGTTITPVASLSAGTVAAE